MQVPDDLIIQAFALSRARGAELLAILGGYDVWQGDLAEMRRDFVHAKQDSVSKQPSPPKSGPLSDLLTMARAIELLDSDCRERLLSAYGLRSDSATGEHNEQDTRTSEGTGLTRCKNRLVELYVQLENRSGDQSTPDWVAEREHAAISAPHGRARR